MQNSIRRAIMSLPVVSFIRIATAFASFPFAMQADIVAALDGPSENRPIVNNYSEIPLVNIVAARMNGISNNQYNQFDPGPNGVIFGNADKDNSTESKGEVGGGSIQASRKAKIILNQIVGSAPTKLTGCIKVEGEKADIIIVNPNGIVLDGCRFENANRVILTTGVPGLELKTDMDGLKVNNGSIVISKNGLMASEVDQFLIIARNIEVTASVDVKGIFMLLAGNYQIEYSHTSFEFKKLSNESGAPDVAMSLDAPGTIRANSICFCGTEKNLALFNGNVATQGGGFLCSHPGGISLGGTISSVGDIVVDGGEVILIPEAVIRTLGSGTLTCPNDLLCRGSNVVASLNLTVKAGGDIDIYDSVLEAGAVQTWGSSPVL